VTAARFNGSVKLRSTPKAGAKRIEFGVEWQGVKSKGVYRRTIADDGKGMTSSELEQFFNEFGGGGKPIGDEHENYDIGSKTSLLPWNRFGVVQVSIHAPARGATPDPALVSQQSFAFPKCLCPE
jgi:hypothetical protein